MIINMEKGSGEHRLYLKKGNYRAFFYTEHINYSYGIHVGNSDNNIWVNDVGSSPIIKIVAFEVFKDCKVIFSITKLAGCIVAPDKGKIEFKIIKEKK